MNKKGNSRSKESVKKKETMSKFSGGKNSEEDNFEKYKMFLQKKREGKDINEEEEREEEEYIGQGDNEKISYEPFEPYNIPKTIEEHKNNLEDLINRSDFLLEFIDIRNLKGTRCLRLENSIKINKKLILVLGKADIFSQDFIEKKIDLLKKENNLVLVVSSYIREKIIEMYEQLKQILFGNNTNNIFNKKCIKIGVIGYPNMGKNTFIKSIQLLSEANSCDKIIYFNNKSFGIDSLPGTIFEKDDKDTLFISKEFKDIYLIPNPENLFEKLFQYIDKNKIKEIYDLNEINNISDLIKEFSFKFQYDFNESKLIYLHIMRDMIDAKINYDIDP